MTTTAPDPVRTRALVLLQVEPGCAVEAARFVATVPCVVEAVATSGPYDVIATVHVDGEPGLQRTLELVRRTPGLAFLRTCRAA